MNSTATDAGTSFRMGQIVIRADLNRLENDGASLSVEPRVMDALQTLAKANGEVVSRTQMIEKVWGVEFGGDESLSRAISILRKTIKKLGENELYIETIPKRGYRLVQPVDLNGSGDVPATPTVTRGALTRELPELPSIAVLPFEISATTEGQEFVVDGLMEEVVAALTRIRTLFVIASGSSHSLKGQDDTPIEAGKKLGVRYVVDGKAQRMGDRLRIWVELIDVANGGVVWQDKFDGAVEEIFDLYDQVAIGVAGVIEFSVQTRETVRASRRPTSDLKAYELYLRGLSRLRTYTRQGMYDALDLLTQALVHDPDYALAHSLIASCHANIAQSGWSENPARSLELAEHHIVESLTHGSDDPQVVATGSLACKISGDLDGSSRLAERAYELNPGSSFTQMVLGSAKVGSGQFEEAEQLLQLSIKLDPFSPNRTLQVGYLAALRFASGDYAEAADLANEAVKYGQSPPIFSLLVASCAKAGRLDRARAILDRLERESAIPISSAASTFFEDPQIVATFREGITLAREAQSASG